jgi:hypothetical protein
MSEFDPNTLRTVPLNVQPHKTSGSAITSLVFGILTWIFLPLIGAIVAVTTGNNAKKEIENSNGSITGSGMATAGLILGWVHLGLTILAVVVIVILMILGPSINSIFSEIQNSL